MRALLFLIVYCSSGYSQQVIKAPSFGNLPWLDLLEIETIMAKKKLYSIDQSYALPNALISADQVWVDLDWQSIVLVKFGVKLSVPEKSFREGDYEFVQLETKSGVPFIMVWYRLNQFQIYPDKSAWNYFRLFDQAKADCCVPESNNLLNSIAAEASDLGITRCVLKSFESLKSDVANKIDNLNLLFTDIKSWARAQVENIIRLKEFITNIKSEIKNLVISVRELSGDQAAMIACGLMGPFLPQIALALAGVGLPSLTREIAEAFLKLKKFGTLIKNLARYKIGRLDAMASCLAY